MKKSSPSDRYVRIPVRYVDERWECAYGGVVPVAKDSEAELIINSKSITDRDFLAQMRAKSCVKVLDRGAKWLVYLATKDQSTLSDELKGYLLPWLSSERKIAVEYIDNWNSGELSLLEVSIGYPTEQQVRKFGTTDGGLWLLTEGRKAVGLESTRISLPKAVSETPVNSLNHAFTKLSEVYEPWRISHTGNVYQRFLYKENDNRWYPLELLRNAALAEREQAIAYHLWQTFLNHMSDSSKTSER